GLLWNADAVLVHSRFIEREIAGLGAFPVERIHRLGFPIGDEFQPGAVSAFRAELGLHDASLLLFVGRLAPNKGLPTLVEALARLREFMPAVHLLIAGRIEDLYQTEMRRCLERAEELGIAERLHFLGHRTGAALADAYRAADVFVTASRW